TFILLSGDSDFSMLVIKLKEYGKYVIGVGIRESASDMLIQNCDEYFSYSDLAGLTKEVEVPSVQRDPWELAREAVAQMARNGDVMRSDRLKQVMQQLDPNFDERNAGPRFSRFSKFVIEAGQRGVLQLSKLENGQYQVAPVGAPAPAPAAALGPGAPAPPAAEPAEAAEPAGRRGRGRRGGRGRERERERPPAGAAPPAARPAEARRDGQLTLARAFRLLGDALGQLKAPVPHEALRLRMVAMHGRDDTLLDPARFARFLRQASDAEVADVRKVSEGEYEVSPHPHDGGPAPRPLAGEPAETVAPAAPAEPEAETRNGQRLGLRFRRGSRGAVRMAAVPLIGVVHVDAGEATEAAAAEPAAAEPGAEAAPAPRHGRGPGRGGRGVRGGRKRAGGSKESPGPVAAEPEAAAGPSAELEPPAAPPRRPSRARTRRKPE
ncbi:MAG TPA: NYN domain-containing protein, partial [Gemmatimonadales bacterium]|nr:NYN domain-containing protein [Gemmatimonadales bacterium]